MKLSQQGVLCPIATSAEYDGYPYNGTLFMFHHGEAVVPSIRMGSRIFRITYPVKTPNGQLYVKFRHVKRLQRNFGKGPALRERNKERDEELDAIGFWKDS